MAEVFVEDPNEELHRKIEEREQSKTNSVLRNVDPKILALLAIGTLIGLYLMVNKPDANYKGIAALLAAVIIMVLFIGKAREASFKKLTERECKAALLAHLRHKQTYKTGDHYELPKGTIHVEAVTREKYMNNEAWKRGIRFTIHGENGLDYCYWAEINIHNGDIITIAETPHKPDGTDYSDIRTIHKPSEDLQSIKRAWGFVGRKI